MKPSLMLAASAFALALASSAAGAQTVISRSVSEEPVETTVAQTPTGTIVTRRPLAQEPGALVAPQVTGPVLAPAPQPTATFVNTAPETVDKFTTRQVVERAAVESEARPMITRQVSAARHRVVERPPVRHVSATVRPRPPAAQITTHQRPVVATAVRQRPIVSAAVPQRPVVSSVVRQRPVVSAARERHIVQRSAPIVRPLTTRQVSLIQPAPRLVLNPREREIVYRTIVEREVVPRQPVIVAPAPTYVAPAPVVVAAPIVAADETVVTAPIPVGTVLPPNVPLFAMPQNVALTVPATRRYSYAWLGGRAYVVDPASGVVVADLAE